MTEKKKPVHYVNNAEFLEAIVEYKKACVDAENSGDIKPQISNYLGECILKIARKLSNRPNFINYSYKDDMILDGIENCIQYFDNFNPEKSSNPFSYFTQIIYYAYLRRIEKEKKQAYIKGKLVRDNTIEAYDVQDHDMGEGFSNSFVDFMQDNGTFDSEFEDRRKKKRQKPQTSVLLDNFIEEDINE
jgi:hypothetical protein